MPKSGTKKDACYRQVKAQVMSSGGKWPSAYASGRIVKCRQKKGYGNAKTKKGNNLRSSIKKIKMNEMNKNNKTRRK